MIPAASRISPALASFFSWSAFRLSAYDYYYGEGSALSALMNSNEWVAKLVRNLSTIKDENNGKARKYASLKQYYEKGYFNEAAYAYLLDYFGVA